MPRRPLGPVVALLVALTPVSPAAAEPAPMLVIEGKGFGHGVGMPQDGAFAMAAAGASAQAILSRFYPGTTLARRSAMVRVAVHEAPGPVVVVLPGGGEIRDAASGPQSPGFPVTVNPGGSVRLSFDGKFRVLPQSGAAINRAAAPPAAAPAAAAPAATTPPTTAPATTVTTGALDPLIQAILPTTVPPAAGPPPVTAAPDAPVTVPPAQNDAVSGRALSIVPRGDSAVSLPGPGRSYRGTVQASAGGGGLALTNDIDVEQYVRGLGEMPASWPAAALQAQAIAARTFAVRAAAAGRTLCDDQQCQVYIGSGNEHPATSAAAAATKGQVLTYKGELAETVYSASAGGLSATPEEGFGPGSPDLPYLTPVAYEVGDPQLWAFTLPIRQAAARFGYRGELRQVSVSRTGPSGRPLEITFDGDNGPMAIDAHRFWAELDLRSTMFSLRTEIAEPPAEGESLVVLGPDLPVTGSPRTGSRAVTAAAVTDPVGRAPWVGLALLLMVASGSVARRVGTRRALPAGTAGPPADPGSPAPPDPGSAGPPEGEAP